MKKNNKDLDKQIWGVLGTLLTAEWWANGGHHDLAQRILLSDMKATGVITGGRPSWAPPQRSAAQLRLILGGKYMSKAEVLAKYKCKV